MQENYLNHPTFGLLYSLCAIDDKQAIYTTLYAQRLFFRVHTLPPEADPNAPMGKAGFVFDPISRNEARQAVEEQLRILRRSNRKAELERLQGIHKQTFT